MAALVVLVFVLGYGLTQWWPVAAMPETVPARQTAAPGVAAEKVAMPGKGAPVRMLAINAGNYFVPEDPGRSKYRQTYKKVEAREALAEVIMKSGADMVGLCEMGGEGAVSDLQARLKRKGVHLPYQTMVMRKGEDRGLAFLSKYPVARDASVQDMPLPGEVRRGRNMLRGVLDATVKLPDGRQFRLVGVHLKSRKALLNRDETAEDVRRKEAYALRDYLNGVMGLQEGMPLVLYGDFNDGPADEAMQVIQGEGKSAGRLNRLKPRDSRGETWTIYYNDGDSYHSFDHLFINQALQKRLGGRPVTGVVDIPESRLASDHRGVWVELR